MTSIEKLIDDYCIAIMQVLKKNGIEKTSAAMKVSILADKGEPMARLDRVNEFLHYLEEHNDKINATEFRNLTAQLMEKYPN